MALTNNNSRTDLHYSILPALLVFVLLLTSELAGDNNRNRETAPLSISKIAAITDRAAGTHNGSNIGLFFENRGKLYPRRLADGPSGEFPINSGHHYIYRINPMVGVAPDAASGRQANVMQGRYTENEEFEAMGGFHNPSQARVAFSDQPNTWPAYGWPVQDNAGNPHIVSSQDSYCVFDDANNTVEQLGIQVAQTGYAFGLSYAEDLLFFTYELTNNTATPYDSVYFAMYLDFDIGNISGGDPEYLDDVLGFDEGNAFVTLRDREDYSAEWGGATGIIGMTFLETPMLQGTMAGVTDLHYNLASNDIDDDSLQMVILSSNTDYLPSNFPLENYVHTGSDGNTRIDDVNLIDPALSTEYVITMSSGPFTLGPNDTLKFITCLVAGTNDQDLYSNLSVAQDLYALNFETPKPPLTPNLNGLSGDNEVTLYWTNVIESEPDKVSNILDFEGYNLYRSLDRGVSWDQIDRNVFPDTGPDPVPLASFDRQNGIGDDLGIQYHYTDESVINGFEYWYSLTAFDQGDSNVVSLESAIGNTTDAINTLSIIPMSAAAAVIPASAQDVWHSGKGHSNYTLDVTPLTFDQLDEYAYELSFDYTSRAEKGNPGVIAVPFILDSSATGSDHYGIEFIEGDKFNLHNLSTGEIIREAYPFRIGPAFPLTSAMKVQFEISDTSSSPHPGDYLSLIFSATLKRTADHNTITVMPTQRFDTGTQLVSDDGLLFSLNPQEELQDINIPPTLNFDIEFQVDNASALIDTSYHILIDQILSDSGTITLVMSVRTIDLGEVIEADTISSGSDLSFNGIVATISFSQLYPPPVGTMISLTSVPESAPSIQDIFHFGIADRHTEPELSDASLDAIRVVPNPYVIGSLWEIEFGELRREPLRQIQFINLPEECDIYIFTLAGGLIKTLHHQSYNGTETWDLRAEGGREIAAGVYLYQVRADGIKYFNRFAVIK